MHIKGETSQFSRLKTGYGIICSKGGWILTCNNIASDITNIKAKTKNEEPFEVGLFHRDTDLDLAILKPTKTPVFNEPNSTPSKSKPFKHLEFDHFLDNKHLFCTPALIITPEDNIIPAEVSSSDPMENNVNITKLEVCCTNAKDKDISGCPILAKLGGVLGMVNLSLEKNPKRPNSVLGIASDTIKLYLRSIDKIWSEAEKCIKDINLDIFMLMTYKVNEDEENYNKELKNPQSVYYKYLKNFKEGIFKLKKINNEWQQMIDDAQTILMKIAPSNSVNLEIHFFVKPRSFHEKNQTIYEICKIIHYSFSEIYSDFTFIDTSSVYIFEQLKWFLNWNTLLKRNEDKIKDIQNDYYMVIDVLRKSQLITKEEDSMIKLENGINESVAKFIELLSIRYPSDIDFIVAELHDKRLGKVANFYNGLKINAMELADPFKSAQKSTTANVTGSGFVSEVSSLLCNV